LRWRSFASTHRSDDARTLHADCRVPDARVRERVYASPQTQNCERRFAPCPVIVDGCAGCNATTDTSGARRTGIAINDERIDAAIALSLLAIGCGSGIRGHRAREWGRARRWRAQLRSRVLAFDDNLHPLGGTSVRAGTNALPGARTFVGRAVARAPQRAKPGHRDEPLVTSSEPIRTIRDVHWRRIRYRLALLPRGSRPKLRRIATMLAAGVRKSEQDGGEVHSCAARSLDVHRREA